MKTFAEIVARIKAAETVAREMVLRNIEPINITNDHRAAARELVASIVEFNDAWAYYGANDRAEWEKFSAHKVPNAQSLVTGWLL